ncbi:MAG: hypothetical protein H7067_04035 [Burkholderiales bacterium]|nr:hypothetical protein [Opitutaceae bacterium]
MIDSIRIHLLASLFRAALRKNRARHESGQSAELTSLLRAISAIKAPESAMIVGINTAADVCLADLLGLRQIKAYAADKTIMTEKRTGGGIGGSAARRRAAGLRAERVGFSALVSVLIT